MKTQCALKSAAIGFTATSLALGNAVSEGRRTPALSIAKTQAGVVLSWTAQSAVPAPGREILPVYQVVAGSLDGNWSTLGEPASASSSEASMEFIDQTDAPARFYRIESIIDQPFAELTGADLFNGELAFANLFGAVLFGARLENCDLFGADLAGTDLRFAQMRDARLDDADLFATDLLLADLSFSSAANADISFSNLSGADLISTNLEGANLRSSILASTDLRLARLHHALIDEHTMIDDKWRTVWKLVSGLADTPDFSGSDFLLANLTDASLRGLNFQGADFSACRFNGSDVRGSDFTGANLRFAIWQDAVMDETTIIEERTRLAWDIVNHGAVNRDLEDVDLTLMVVGPGDMRRVNLKFADLQFTVFDRSNMGGADLSGANLSNASFFRTTLTNANLSNVNLSFADLTEANLLNANLDGTSLAGVTFNQTIMPDGSVRNR